MRARLAHHPGVAACYRMAISVAGLAAHAAGLANAPPGLPRRKPGAGHWRGCGLLPLPGPGPFSSSGPGGLAGGPATPWGWGRPPEGWQIRLGGFPPARVTIRPGHRGQTGGPGVEAGREQRTGRGCFVFLGHVCFSGRLMGVTKILRVVWLGELLSLGAREEENFYAT